MDQGPVDDYASFVRQAAAHVEDHRFKIINMWGAKDGTTHRIYYELVREGSQRFGKSLEQVWDDIQRECEQIQQSPRGKLRHLGMRLDRQRFLLWAGVKDVLYRRTWRRWHQYKYIRQYLREEDAPEPVVSAGKTVPSASQAGPAASKPASRKVSIVMVSYNRKEYTRECLEAFHDTVDYDNYELIAVDNGSTDGSTELLKREAERGRISRVILRKRNHGTSPGFNCGFAAAAPDTEFYVKLDSDIIMLTRGWVRELVRLFEQNPKIGLLAVNQITHTVLRSLPAERINGDALINMCKWVCGSFVMIPKPVLMKVGYLNEDYSFLYMPDDIDYYYRLARCGYEAYYARDLLSYHRQELDLTKYRAYTRTKKHLVETGQHQRALQEAARQFDRGDTSVSRFYDRYASYQLPEGKVVEIE